MAGSIDGNCLCLYSQRALQHNQMEPFADLLIEINIARAIYLIYEAGIV